ncbi:hypothetical protein M0802_008243 [Mischocyttarus mexicanus]|nr:hypothetical protein M0802_008243 [Mischocyttarus mexicanus]
MYSLRIISRCSDLEDELSRNLGEVVNFKLILPPLPPRTRSVFYNQPNGGRYEVRLNKQEQSACANREPEGCSSAYLSMVSNQTPLALKSCFQRVPKIRHVNARWGNVGTKLRGWSVDKVDLGREIEKRGGVGVQAEESFGKSNRTTTALHQDDEDDEDDDDDDVASTAFSPTAGPVVFPNCLGDVS